MEKKQNYVLVTAARNEEAFIEQTINGVVSQTLRPVLWIIVSDGSTDKTDEIIKRYASKYSFIHFLKMPTNNSRDFASKVYALKKGIGFLESVNYQFIGNLDADISLEPFYYKTMINKLNKNDNLGIAGGIIIEKTEKGIIEQDISLDSVAGAIQLFHKKCYEQTGGYQAQLFGGEDAEVEIKARMHGWEVKTFKETTVLHLRPIGAEQGSQTKYFYRQGKMFYRLGYHPLFFFIRSIYKLFHKPFITSSLIQLCGFAVSMLKKEEHTVPLSVKKFLQKEQLKKMKFFPVR